MRRGRAVAFACAVAAVVACGGADDRARVATPKGSGSAAAPPPPPIRDVECSEVPQGLSHAVTVVLNMEPLRAHPVGKRLGPLVFAIPQWRPILTGVVTDPVREIDWAYLSGPSMTDSSKDVVYVHHTLSDEAIERGLDLLQKRSPTVVPYDVGVPSVKATFTNLDQGPRILIRAKPQLLAVVPPEWAKQVSTALVRTRLKSPATAAEGVRAYVENPHAGVPSVPASIKTALLSVVPRPDGGAEVFADAQCDDEASAAQIAEGLVRMRDRYNNFVTRLMTAGILDALQIGADGATVKVRLSASPAQVTRVVGLVATMTGVDLDTGN